MTALYAQRAEVHADRDAVRVITYPNTTAPGEYDIEAVNGATLALPIAWADGDAAALKDLSTGYTAALTVRSAWDSTTALITLTESDGLTLASAMVPNLTVARTASQTAAWTWVEGVYALTVSHTATARTWALLAGRVMLLHV